MKELLEKIKAIKTELIEELKDLKDQAALKTFQETKLSKKSPINALMSNIKDLQGEERAAFGQAVNELRKEIQEAFVKNQKRFVE